MVKNNKIEEALKYWNIFKITPSSINNLYKSSIIILHHSNNKINVERRLLWVEKARNFFAHLKVFMIMDAL